MFQPKCELLDRVLIIPNQGNYKFVEGKHWFGLVIESKNSIMENTIREEYLVKEIWWRRMQWIQDQEAIKLKDILASYLMWKLWNVKQSRWLVRFQNKESELIKNYIYNNKISKDEILSFLDDKEVDYSSL